MAEVMDRALVLTAKRVEGWTCAGLVSTLVCILICTFVSTEGIRAQTPNADCQQFESAVTSKDISAAIVPDILLTDRRAVKCLLQIIGSLNRGGPTRDFSSAELNRFLSATAALRAMLLSATVKSELSNLSDEYRRLDNLDVTGALVRGLRQSNDAARVNARALLINFIGNRTYCVPLDNLLDPALSPRDRVNLLHVMNQYVPYLYAENYDNACRVLEHVEEDIKDKDTPQASAIVANLRQRIRSQTDKTNQSVYLPDDEKACYSYRLEWGKALLRYTRPARAYRVIVKREEAYDAEAKRMMPKVTVQECVPVAR